MTVRQSASYEGVALVAPVTFGYQRYSDHGAAWFFGGALAQLLDAARVAKTDIDGLSISSFSLAPDSVTMLAHQLGLTPRWIDQVVTAGANGVMMARRVARAIQAGDVEIVACMGADTLQRHGFSALASNFSRETMDAVYPYGSTGPNGVFAMMTQNYMNEFGATREDFGRICVAQRQNARDVPHALLRSAMSLQDYLDARPIAEPLHLFDCVMPCAGAEGYLMMSVERAAALTLPYAVMLSAAEQHNAYAEDPIQIRGGWAVYSDELYANAALGPEDMDFVQSYDDYPVIVMQHLEDMGFCNKGDGPRFVRETALTWDGGGLPVNTSGGLLSTGQAGAASGMLSMVEGLRQLIGPDLGNRIEGASVGLVSGYGMASYNHCLSTSSAIIARGPS